MSFATRKAAGMALAIASRAIILALARFLTLLAKTSSSDGMNYPVDAPLQLRAVLKSLRKSRSLTQAQLGAKLGLSQKRVAGIENNPQVTSIDQISRIVSLLGARLVVEELDRDDKSQNQLSHSGW
jgi:HTH-type transcriptional regulator/antitoxin HipB